MVFGWSSIASTVMTVFEVATTIGVGIACPPLAPVVGGAFAIGGALVNHVIDEKAAELAAEREDQEVQHVQQQVHQGLSDEEWKALKWRFEDIENGMKDNQKFINKTRQELWEVKDKIGDNQDFIKANMREILKNQKILRQTRNIVHQNQQMLTGIREMINITARDNKEMLNNLGNSLKTFELNTERNFDKLKSFIVEKDFIKDFLIPIRHLFELMEDAYKRQSKMAIENFMDDYTEHKSGIRLLNKMVGQLDYDHTNPVTSAMIADPLNSRDILNHYMHLFSSIVVKVIAIDGFYYGLTDRSKRSTAAKMEELSVYIEQNINKMRDFFMKIEIPKDKYWPELVEQTALSMNVQTNEHRVADKIKQQLDGIYTKDVFSIFAFRCENSNTCEPSQLVLNASVPFEGKPMIGNLNKETHVRTVVLRSEKFHEIDEGDTLALRLGFRSYQTLMARWDQNPCDKGPFSDVLIQLLEEPSDLNGFLICGIANPGAARISANETNIITEDDMDGKEKFYYGLSWI